MHSTKASETTNKSTATSAAAIQRKSSAPQEKLLPQKEANSPGSKTSVLQKKSGLQAVISEGSGSPDSIPSRNVALSSLITSGIQPKLEVGSPDDKFEQEADAAADKVMRMPGPTSDKEEPLPTPPVSPGISRMLQPKEKVENEDELVQTLQRQSLKNEEDPIQRATLGEEEPLRRQPVPGPEKEIMQTKPVEDLPEVQTRTDEQEEPVMRKTDESGSGHVPSSVENVLGRSKGAGSSLPGPVKNYMEPRFGSDFSDVRIHTGPEATRMNKALRAQAFTHGNDIYFGANRFNPGTSSGKSLIAHELTHTIQQTGGRIQKQDDETSASGAGTADTAPAARNTYTIDEGEHRGIALDTTVSPPSLHIPGLSLPRFKRRNRGKFPPQLTINKSRSETNQVENWKSHVASPVESEVSEMVNDAEAQGGKTGSDVYMFRAKRDRNFYLIGTSDELKERAKIPFWDDRPRAASFQVDHIVEDQLGGEDKASNYELLEATANMSAGSKLGHEIRRRIQAAKSELQKEYPDLALPDWIVIKRTYDVTFTEYDFGMSDISGEPNTFWSVGQIIRNAHLDKLRPLKGEEVREMGEESEPFIFTSPGGGQRLRMPPESQLPVQNWLPRVDLKGYTLNTEQGRGTVGGHLNVDAYKAAEGRRREQAKPVSASYPDMNWTITPIPGIYGGYINMDSVQSYFRGGAAASLRLPGMSPIRVDSIEIQPGVGIVARGKVLPSIPFIRDADIDITILGNEVILSKTFALGEINVPPPFELTSSTLSIFYSTGRGLGIEGETNFGIQGVGEGHVGAAASTSGGFELEGAFNFDTELFDPAEISVEYKENTWTIGGEIGIPEGKVRGIRSATIQATYSENNFEADGEAELDIPAIERGTLSVRYGEAGFSVGGSFDISPDVPGIRGGRVEATVTRESGQEDYSVSVVGTAEPDIPGVDTTLSVVYIDGAITIEGTAAYSRGMLSGNVLLGATNRAVNEEGQPAGEPDDTMSVYGGGSLTLQLTPWLAATAGVRFLPNGEMEVQGRIGLPDTVDVFPRKEFRKNLFTAPTIEIPLFAIPLGPRSIGLVAQIRGGLDFAAGFGPGQLRELYAEVTYNPDREEETTVHGRGLFVIPADAGLTLRGDLGLGVSVGIASLTGGIELQGTLGLQGEASAMVDVNWTPQLGIALDAEGRVMVNPRFAFAVNAFARASLDLWLVSVSETWRHNLAGFEWGPDIQFGVVFPIHYREGEPFDLSLDDIEVIYPQLDIPEMAKGLALDIKDDFLD
ncbi:DUF4157 domain-containing protein [Halalkalibaculum sp. DA3122]|uniref:eCIS core domain-containing protein n=1 Tax=unclassified Halalkalibaculum TaxID=2964617 RepID=UPI003754A93E